jgi:ppGpp synthetase/RelA/SpoT-type nucleotidyltranferase
VEKHLSNAQIDRLGERLRRQEHGEAELKLLDEYRRTFGPIYDRVVSIVRRVTSLPVSGRPAKSTSSIIEKLNRESIRLSQMQDIAGCRIVVADMVEQDRVVTKIVAAFESISVSDRREKPSHGYRAVHLIIRESSKLIEVQIRTTLQHIWAEICEKCADIVDPAIKYGGGPSAVRNTLDRAAQQVHRMESIELTLAQSGAADGALARELRKIGTEYVKNFRLLLEELDKTD